MPDKLVKEEEYEIVPHQILADLRDEIDALKKKLEKPEEEVGKELLASMAELKLSVNDLLNIIKKASEDMKKEEKGLDLGKAVFSLTKKVDELSRQNEEIAAALVSIGDTVDNMAKRPAPMPLPRQMPPPRAPPLPPRPMPQPRPQAPPMPPPRPVPSMPSFDDNMPPPPPMGPMGSMEFEPEKKKGFLGSLFKK